MVRYNEVIEFFERENRNPSKYDAEERGRYGTWLKHNRKLYNSGEMKEERMSKFKELVYLCEANRHANQYV